jgi:hypothetical protein
MARIFNALVDYMSDEDWRFDILEGKTLLKFNVQVKSGRLVCYGEAEEDREIALFYSYLPANAPEDRRAAVAEFLTRANHGMRVGNFEMDYRDGEIRYKTSIDVEGGELSPKMIENLLNANLSTMDRYFTGLMSVIFSNERSPAELIDAIERPHPVGGDDDDEFDD